MKSCQFMLATISGILLATSTGLTAGTVVSETDSGDLMVIEYKGKPPHKRRWISSSETAEFARFKNINESVLVTTAASDRRGPPGKSLPAQQARIERVPQSEITQFARFEETADNANTRRWRGAPGKGRPLSR